MPHILFDFRGPQYSKGRGIARYSQELALHYCKSNPTFNYSFLIDPILEPLDQMDELLKWGNLYSINDLVTYALEHDFKVDVFFVMSFFHPLMKFNVYDYIFPSFFLAYQPIIVGVCYDLILKIFPSCMSKVYSYRYEQCIECLKKCDHIFSISESTTNDCINLIEIDPKKITTVMGSIDFNKWNSLSKIVYEKSENTLKKFQLIPKNFFLYVGNIQFNKNVERLVQAFSHLKRYNMKLVIACNINELQKTELYKLMSESDTQKYILFTGFISDEDLAVLYSSAYATIFPSLYEGLGLPILESYFFNTPVISSNTSSMQEIVHPDCTFNPYDVQSIADKIVECVENRDLSKISLDFGKGVLAGLVWDKLIEKVNHSLNQLINRQTPPQIKVRRDLAVIQNTSVKKTYDLSNHSVNFFGNLTLFSSRATLDNRFLHHKDFEFYDAIFLYRKLLFVVSGKNPHLVCFKKITEKTTANRKSYLYLLDGNLNAIWMEFFKHDLKKLKEFYKLYYAEQKNQIDAVKSLNQLNSLEIYGIKPIIILGKFEKIGLSKTVDKENIKNEIMGSRIKNCSLEFFIKEIL